jgi:putative glutamine amidotransferase
VNSFHGQAVGRVALGLTVSARASDGVVEALEMPDRTFVVATQWHPEIPPQQMKMFEALTEAAKSYRSNAAVHQQ